MVIASLIGVVTGVGLVVVGLLSDEDVNHWQWSHGRPPTRVSMTIVSLGVTAAIGVALGVWLVLEGVVLGAVVAVVTAAGWWWAVLEGRLVDRLYRSGEDVR